MNKADICALMVTYHPDGGLAERLTLVARQVQGLVVVDNGSTAAATRVLHEATHSLGIDVVLNSENRGIARALNIGIERALSFGYPWVLLLDQDSVVDATLVGTLISIHESFDDKSHLAMIGSGYRDLRREMAKADTGSAPGSERAWDETDGIITSGSLLSLAAHAIIGPFRDEFFIDHVDFEYCLRARARGFRILNSRRPLMRHQVGTPVIHQLLWKKTLTTNHSPDRLYYFARNDTVLLRESGKYRFGTWTLKSFGRRFRTCKRVVLYEQSKWRKVVAVAHGFWDGVKGTLGPRKKWRLSGNEAERRQH